MANNENFFGYQCFCKNDVLNCNDYKLNTELTVKKEDMVYDVSFVCKGSIDVMPSNSHSNLRRDEVKQVVDVSCKRKMICNCKYCTNFANTNNLSKVDISLVHKGLSNSLSNHIYCEKLIEKNDTCDGQDQINQTVEKNSNSFLISTRNGGPASVIVKNNERLHEALVDISDELISVDATENLSFDLNRFQTTSIESNEEAVSSYKFNSSPAYATLTPLQPLPPISTMSDKFVYRPNTNEGTDIILDNDNNHNTHCLEAHDHIDTSITAKNVSFKKSQNTQTVHDSSYQHTLTNSEDHLTKSISSKSVINNLSPELYEPGYNKSLLLNISSVDVISQPFSNYENITGSVSRIAQKRSVNSFPTSNCRFKAYPNEITEECEVIAINSAIASGFDYTSNKPTNTGEIRHSCSTTNSAYKTVCSEKIENENIKINDCNIEINAHEPFPPSSKQDTLGNMTNTASNIQLLHLDGSMQRKNIFIHEPSSPAQELLQYNCGDEKNESSDQESDETTMLHNIQYSQKEHQNMTQNIMNLPQTNANISSSKQRLIDIMSKTHAEQKSIFNYSNVEEINTKDLAQCISLELKRYSIPQAVFAQRVLCRSQGTLSDLLRNPKPWSKLKSGRETFRRMLKWLERPEFQRMSSLKTSSTQMFQSYDQESNKNKVDKESCLGKY